MGSSVLVVGVAGLLFVAGPALVVLAVVVATVLTGTARTTPAPSEAAAAARRHGAWVHVGAWASALLVPWVAVVALPAARTGLTGGAYMALIAGSYLALPLLAYLGVHALGERVWPRPAGQVRRAALVARRSPAPRWLAATTLGWAGALVATLAVTALTASGGRRLERGSQVVNGYPGWPFGLTIATAVAVIGLGTWATLRLVARRPAVTGDAAFDEASRRLTAHRVLRGVQLALAVTLAGVLAFTALALSRVGLTVPGTAVGVLAGLAAVAGLGVAVVPAQAASPRWTPPVAPFADVPETPSAPTPAPEVGAP